MAIEDYGSRIAVDARALGDLKARAKSDPREAIKGAAKQFEAYFMQTMLKSMRDTLPQDSIFDNDQSRFYTSMFDQQLSQNLGGKGAMGLARMLEKQLSKGLPESSAADPASRGTSLPVQAALPATRAISPEIEQALAELQANRNAARLQKNLTDAALAANAVSNAYPEAIASRVASTGNASPRDFAATVWPYAVEAAQTTGLPPYLMVAHAALESGWGKREPRRADGSPTYNLFGIKAGRSWTGDSVESNTVEYSNGQSQNKVEKFRAYGSYREAFLDYANLLAASPRYASVLASGSGTEFANSLQQSGYATDPMYAAKLTRIIQGKTLRDALQG